MYKNKKIIILSLVISSSFMLYGCSDKNETGSGILNGINISTSNEADKYALLEVTDFTYKINEDNSISMESIFKNISGKKIRDCKPRLNIEIPYETNLSDEEILSVHEDFVSGSEDVPWGVGEEKTFKSTISIDNIVKTAKNVGCEDAESIEGVKQIIEKKEFSLSYTYNYMSWFKLVQIQGSANVDNLEFSEQVYFMGL